MLAAEVPSVHSRFADSTERCLVVARVPLKTAAVAAVAADLGLVDLGQNKGIGIAPAVPAAVIVVAEELGDEFPEQGVELVVVALAVPTLTSLAAAELRCSVGWHGSLPSPWHPRLRHHPILLHQRHSAAFRTRRRNFHSHPLPTPPLHLRSKRRVGNGTWMLHGTK